MKNMTHFHNECALELDLHKLGKEMLIFQSPYGVASPFYCYPFYHPNGNVTLNSVLVCKAWANKYYNLCSKWTLKHCLMQMGCFSVDNVLCYFQNCLCWKVLKYYPLQFLEQCSMIYTGLYLCMYCSSHQMHYNRNENNPFVVMCHLKYI